VVQASAVTTQSIRTKPQVISPTPNNSARLKQDSRETWLSCSTNLKDSNRVYVKRGELIYVYFEDSKSLQNVNQGDRGDLVWGKSYIYPTYIEMWGGIFDNITSIEQIYTNSSKYRVVNSKGTFNGACQIVEAKNVSDVY
jgi:hypothetical protein